MAILLETMRPERVSQKVKPLLLRLHQLGLRAVQGQPDPLHHCRAELQRLRRAAAAENHEVIGAVNDDSPELTSLPRPPPVLQKAVPPLAFASR